VEGSYLSYEIDYFMTGHFSKFVQTGAILIGSQDTVDEIETSAFQNPDGSLCLVALNNSYSSKSFYVIWNDMSFYYSLPGQSLVTFVWPG
ncbi:MAG: glucan endo-1,6-beta-glucosidase, partial [FCB group bacterium]|nr:glucan endo-1,6-beta-glucosidase [FCB group bacterium]